MQKKIYPLCFVPCFLALCLALVFLASCGDDTSSNGDTPTTPVKPPPYQPPIGNNDPKVNISNLDTSFIGWRLRVRGNVDLIIDGTDQTVIKKIVITLNNMVTGGSVDIPLTDNIFGNSYDLIDGQVDGFDISKNCDHNTGRFQIYVSVFLSTNNTTIPDKVGNLGYEYEKPYEGCRNDFTINTFVSPEGSGTVTLNPQPPYSKNQQVTVTANPSGSYTFLNWSDDGYPIGSENPLTVTVSDSKSLTANFVENFTLVKDEDASKNYKVNDDILGAVKFTGSNFVALGNARVNEMFKKDDGTADQISTSTVQPSPTLSASRFTPADGFDWDEIGYTVNYYFIVKTTSAGGWRTWYLMYGTNDGSCSTAANPKCTSVTVWKVQ